MVGSDEGELRHGEDAGANEEGACHGDAGYGGGVHAAFLGGVHVLRGGFVRA